MTCFWAPAPLPPAPKAYSLASARRGGAGLTLGQHHASLRGKTLAAIQNLQPPLEEEAYYLVEQHLNAEDGLACLRLFAADDPVLASDALALLDGTVSRAESHAQRKAHFA